MINKYFEDEEIQQNDLFFMCSMIERVARKIHQRNKYVVNALGFENFIILSVLQMCYIVKILIKLLMIGSMNII